MWAIGIYPTLMKIQSSQEKAVWEKIGLENPERPLYVTLNDVREVDGDNRPDENTAWRQTVKSDGWF